MIIDDLMTDKITLHGLGFVQIQLEANHRLHVWHPELPRRSCFEHSSIHDHRFDFASTVLVGSMANHVYYVTRDSDEGEFVQYLHEGKRSPNGGRPWTPDGNIDLELVRSSTISAGQCYLSTAYVFHRTEALGNGKVATLMHKTHEFSQGAHSTCLAGVQPDTDFDRFQWSASQLWEIVRDVIVGVPFEKKTPVPNPRVQINRTGTGTVHIWGGPNFEYKLHEIHSHIAPTDQAAIKWCTDRGYVVDLVSF